ncbi:hypothetical protein HDU67_000884 [Dinochytrium kinnereticum]|nr:hypothetical protein HDU67_000884 [Dinochytrium kinnereticum]
MMIKYLTLAITGASLLSLVTAIPAAVQLVARNTPAISIEPKTLTIDDMKAGAEIGIRLLYAPSSAVTVYLEAPGLQLTACSLKFNPSEANILKKVRIVGGGFDTVTSYTLKAALYDPKPTRPMIGEQTAAINRLVTLPANCYSNGDPHYKTFDGKLYNFYGAGVYYLVRTPTLIVQADQQHCTPTVTCNYQVAIQFGSTVIVLAPAPGSRTVMALTLLSANSQGITATANAAKNSYQISISDGSLITVSMYPWGSTYYMDISITAAGSHMNKVNGLCGNFNKNAADDTLTPATFAVPASENIFTRRSGLILTTACPPTTFVCKIPNLTTPPNTDGCDTFVPPGWNSVPMTTGPALKPRSPNAKNRIIPNKPLKKIMKPAKIKKLCNSIRQLDDWCSTNLDVSFFIDSCISDVTLTKDRSLVKLAKKSFLTACGGRAALSSGFKKNRKEGRDIREHAAKALKESETVPDDNDDD